MKRRKRTQKKAAPRASIGQSASFALPDWRAILRQKETWLLVVLCGGVLLFFQTFRTHRIDGISMAPTFATGDRIFVARRAQYQRYDIVTFEPANIQKDSYVKRIIGLPGDRLQVDGQTLYLIPAVATEKEATERAASLTGDPAAWPDGTQVIQLSAYAAHTLSGLETIPTDQYFVEGDNRLHSNDSRAFGLVHRDQLEGVVVWRYYPLSKMGVVH